MLGGVAQMPHEAIAAVYLDERHIGTLGYRDGNTWFDYEDVESEHPVLGQAFEVDPASRRTASGSVPEWFANLLPEPGSGLREMVARELGRKRVHDFALLVHLGSDLPGAVRVFRERNGHDIPELVAGGQRTLDHPLRFSLAGVQPKFSMRYEGKSLVLPMTGQGGDWIVKLPDRRFPDVPANEYSMLTWMSLCGIDVPDIRLVPGSDLSGLPEGLIGGQENALAVRRFDRTAEGRVHQEDFAQVRETPAENKYERASYSGLGRLIATLAPQDVIEYIRRLAAMVVIGNLDAHLKNWTLRYPDRRTPRLSPAYDFVAVMAYPEFRKDVLAFDLGGTRATSAITMNHFRRLAKDMHLDASQAAATVQVTTEQLADTWMQVRNDCPVPAFVADHIEDRVRSLPLMNQQS
jgi:serine/threonine-protein kinase HipA